MKKDDIEEIIEIFFRDELKLDIRDRNQNLIGEGVVDSFNMLELILFVENFCEISIELEDLDLDLFNSVISIAEKIQEWKSR